MLFVDLRVSVRQFPQRHPALEQLIDVVRFVVGHVFGLEVHVVVRELGMRRFTMPVGR